MTGLLEEALRRVESLSREEQDAIASQIIETLDDEEAWARSFREKPALLRFLAREAMQEHRRGETRPLGELHCGLPSLIGEMTETTRRGCAALPGALL
jgi:hypothetical protein